MKEGARVVWRHVPRGGYGYAQAVPGVVVREGAARVLIEVALRDGTKVARWVRPEHLSVCEEAK